MAENRGPRPIYDRELRLWKVGRALSVTFVAAVLVAGGVFYGLVYVLDFQEIDTAKRLDAKTLFDLVRLSFGVVAGAGALVALVVAYRRQRVDEAGAHREATRLHTERFSQAVEQLGSDSPAVQLGGVHALAGLADDAPDDSLRQTCIDVLCAYLQLPFTPDPGDVPAHQEEHHRYLALRKVRHTILRLIGDHYRRPQGTHRSWQGCDLDLTGVIIDGPMDFTGATFGGGRVSFDGATFSGSTVTFDNATFSDGLVSFGNATFGGGRVSFDNATFSGSMVSFYGATFSGGTVTFDNATFSDGTVTFYGAAFSDGLVSFGNATFSDGTVSFGNAEFSGGTVTFYGATFSGGTVSFYGAAFSDGLVSFGNATFSGSAVTFDGATFSGSTVTFDNATFSDGLVSFGNATFSDGLVSFYGAAFSDGTVTFHGATLSDGTVTFYGAAGSPPHGLLDAVGTPVPATVELPAAWLSLNP
ncbi:pentapeptide repeat-containing protein [Streptomyces albus]|uniref:pentapeptide repeat-containing protein n=1 Tax=Streptomyces albus TaxID=1888 RepID=UPI0033EB0274